MRTRLTKKADKIISEDSVFIESGEAATNEDSCMIMDENLQDMKKKVRNLTANAPKDHKQKLEFMKMLKQSFVEALAESSDSKLPSTLLKKTDQPNRRAKGKNGSGKATAVRTSKKPTSSDEEYTVELTELSDKAYSPSYSVKSDSERSFLAKRKQASRTKNKFVSTLRRESESDGDGENSRLRQKKLPLSPKKPSVLDVKRSPIKLILRDSDKGHLDSESTSYDRMRKIRPKRGCQKEASSIALAQLIESKFVIRIPTQRVRSVAKDFKVVFPRRNRSTSSDKSVDIFDLRTNSRPASPGMKVSNGKVAPTKIGKSNSRPRPRPKPRQTTTTPRLVSPENALASDKARAKLADFKKSNRFIFSDDETSDWPYQESQKRQTTPVKIAGSYRGIPLTQPTRSKPVDARRQEESLPIRSQKDWSRLRLGEGRQGTTTRTVHGPHRPKVPDPSLPRGEKLQTHRSPKPTSDRPRRSVSEIGQSRPPRQQQTDQTPSKSPKGTPMRDTKHRRLIK